MRANELSSCHIVRARVCACDCRYVRPPTDKPYAGIVWSGKGTLNGSRLDVDVRDCKEFLVVPDTPAEFCNTGDTTLLVYTAWPIVSRK
jgi:hypothetical protein